MVLAGVSESATGTVSTGVNMSKTPDPMAELKVALEDPLFGGPLDALLDYLLRGHGAKRISQTAYDLATQVERCVLLARETKSAPPMGDALAALRELVRIKRKRHPTYRDAPLHEHITPRTWDDGTPCEWCEAWARAQKIVDEQKKG
jgi:hypothetical protein